MDEFVDAIGENKLVVGVFALYACYFVVLIAALVCMAVEQGAEWPIVFSSVTIFVTSTLHFGLVAFGFTMDGYIPYPIYPEALFLYMDMLWAGALGASIHSFSATPSKRAVPITASVIIAVAQLACFYKSYRLFHDNARSKRQRQGIDDALPPSSRFERW